MTCGFLKGCDAKFASKGLRQTIDAEQQNGTDALNLSPWVRASFIQTNDNPNTNPKNNIHITVGNESTFNPPLGPDQFGEKNHAVIKSMQYSFLNRNGGASCVLEIHDDEGGNFANFYRFLNKSPDIVPGERTPSIQIFLEFGWLASSCNGQTMALGPNPEISQLGPSAGVFLLPMDITTSFEQGKIKFRVECTDLYSRTNESANDTRIGSDTHKAGIKEAIREIFKRNTPSIPRVDFRMIIAGKEVNLNETEVSGKPFPIEKWFFKNEPRIKSCWKQDNLPPLSAVWQWILGLKTKNEKGIIVNWDASKPEPTAVFWENPDPTCVSNPSLTENIIYSYVVNGGRCSPVLSFSPQIKWNYNIVNPQGGNLGTMSQSGGSDSKTKPNCGAKQISKGQSTHVPNAENRIHYGNSIEETASAIVAHNVANYPIGSVEAELRIQGDTTYTHISTVFGKFIGLAVINPFYIRGTTGCGNWTAIPACNSTLSGTWMIEGVDHTIREGSYVTTLKIKLPVANVELLPEITADEVK